MRRILLIFIKNQRPGTVKTRLAGTLGDGEALRIYRILLDKTRAAALDTDAERWLFYSETIERADGWPEIHFQKHGQDGPDLGERMARAFQKAFEAGAGKVLVIGSDCPELTGEILEDAFARLDHSECVIGPAADGGYYLLGLKNPAPAVFRGVPWSTSAVCTATMSILQSLGKTVCLLPVLSDIDTEADWRSYISRHHPL